MVRAEAHDHFTFLAAMRYGLGERTADEIHEEARLGPLLVDAVLPLEPGAVFELSAWAKAQANPETALHSSFYVMPFLTGSLRLMEMEFVHETLGKLPIEAVRPVWQGNFNTYQGVELRPDNVCIQYRRLPL